MIHLLLVRELIANNFWSHPLWLQNKKTINSAWTWNNSHFIFMQKKSYGLLEHVAYHSELGGLEIIDHILRLTIFLPFPSKQYWCWFRVWMKCNKSDPIQCDFLFASGSKSKSVDEWPIHSAKIFNLTANLRHLAIHLFFWKIR